MTAHEHTASGYEVRLEVRADGRNHESAVFLIARNGSEAAERASLEVADLFGVPATAVSVLHLRVFTDGSRRRCVLGHTFLFAAMRPRFPTIAEKL